MAARVMKHGDGVWATFLSSSVGEGVMGEIARSKGDKRARVGIGAVRRRGMAYV